MKFFKGTDTIDALESDYLYVAPSQLAGSGNGLYTATNIYKDEVIALFKGEILTDRQIALRIKKGEDNYFISMLDGRIMDSRKTACFAKYANDAEGLSKSIYRNTSKIAIDEEENVCLVAMRNIKKNEEIFCGYGKRYWKKHG
jgi:SET domain-containing protein